MESNTDLHIPHVPCFVQCSSHPSQIGFMLIGDRTRSQIVIRGSVFFCFSLYPGFFGSQNFRRPSGGVFSQTQLISMCLLHFWAPQAKILGCTRPFWTILPWKMMIPFTNNREFLPRIFLNTLSSNASTQDFLKNPGWKFPIICERNHHFPR